MVFYFLKFLSAHRYPIFLCSPNGMLFCGKREGKTEPIPKKKGESGGDPPIAFHGSVGL